LSFVISVELGHSTARTAESQRDWRERANGDRLEEQHARRGAETFRAAFRLLSRLPVLLPFRRVRHPLL
jgi:hypothetical protein